MQPTIIRGVHTEGDRPYPYVGLGLGKYQYRIYTDREGWFVNGEYTPIVPKGGPANKIKQAVGLAGKPAFLQFLSDSLEKWKLKEMAGI